MDGMSLLTITVLAVFVGFEVVSKVSSTLHTPLMSGANAIHGIILVGAIIVAGQTNSAYPTAGLNLELQAIAAVIIGGASFFGGRGSVLGALVGALILAIIQNGLNLMNVDSSWQYIALGIVIVLAVELDVVRGNLERSLKVARTNESEGGR